MYVCMYVCIYICHLESARLAICVAEAILDKTAGRFRRLGNIQPDSNVWGSKSD